MVFCLVVSRDAADTLFLGFLRLPVSDKFSLLPREAFLEGTEVCLSPFCFVVRAGV